MTETAYETVRIAGIGGIELAVDIWDHADGAAPRPPGFLLVHGLASNARLYDGVAALLVEAGHAVATVDLRGHGRSDKPDDGYDYDTMCGDLSAVLAELAALRPGAGHERPVVVGQSYGANLVLELAARSAERLAGVGCIDGGTIELAGRFSSWEKVRAALAPPKIEGARWTDVRKRAFEMHPDWPATGVEGSLANFEVRADRTVAPWLTLQHHLAILHSMWESRPSQLYPRVTVPVLLMPAESPGAASEWTLAKREGIAEAVATLPKVEVHWFSPADHDVHAQHPNAVAAVLLDATRDFFV
jgi:pimeloyl-ACP methyl ester carboxylesterase